MVCVLGCPFRTSFFANKKEKCVIQRKTQTDAFWREQFAVTSQDLGRIYDLLLDAGRPVATSVLARTLIEDNCRREEARIQAELKKGPVYQPRDSYQVGQQVAFPAADYAWATVVGIRPAHNPGYGDFAAIRVQFEGQTRVREYAAELRGEHKLNRAEGMADLFASGDVQTPAELYEEHGPIVEDKLARALSEHREFVGFGHEWFLEEGLVPVGMGHLNITEALIEVKGMPLTTSELLADLDLPAEVPEEIKVLSLKRALQQDSRFDNVGDSGRDVWYLSRLTPAPVVNPPERLRLWAEPYSREEISAELLLIEREVEEEGLGDEALGPSRPIYRTAFILTYPHWRSGTLPLTARIHGLFPKPTVWHTPIVLVDGQAGDRMQGWVMYERACVYGLQEWYQRHSLPVGALIKLERTRDPRVIMVDFEPQRLRRIWVKVATAHPGALTFQMRKLPVSCQCDEQVILAEESAAAIDELQAQVTASGESLLEIMVRIVPELVKLSPQGTVHAKTVYSAVNLLRRSAPGPVFALLSVEPCFVPMGGGYWSFDETRVRPGAL
jgi:hypothetical protein